MKLTEAKRNFINSWGSLGSQWGINRTMAQIHALMLVSTESLSTEDVMKTLSVSRGNANMNMRNLLDWGLVYKDIKAGERKEFFRAEKDIWTAAKRLIKMRQQKELIPLIQVLDGILNTDIEEDTENETKEFLKQINNIKSFAEQADSSLTKITKSDENWFRKTFIKLLK